MARDRRERQARTHAMPRKQLAQCGEIAHQRSGPRHAAHRQAGASRFTKAFRVAAAMRQRVSHTLRPARSPILAGGVVAADLPVWQIMIRAAQTPAFGAAVMFGLVLTWLGTGAPAHLHSAHGPSRPAQRETLRPAQRETLRISAPATPALGKAEPSSGAIPTTGDHSPVKQDIDPKVFAKLEQVLAELGQEARPQQPPSKSKPLPDSAKTQPPVATPAGQPPDAPLAKTAPTDPASVPTIQHPSGARPGPPA
jgi:hypothetical protein